MSKGNVTVAALCPPAVIDEAVEWAAMAQALVRKGLPPSKLAGALMICAGGLTGLALAAPAPMTIANALLFWAWAASSFHFSRVQTDRRVCRACGAVNPFRLADGGCGACAAPARKSFPDATAGRALATRDSA